MFAVKGRVLIWWTVL